MFRRLGPLLAPIRSTRVNPRERVPYFKRVQEKANRQRNRQLPFLHVSREPSARPPLPDPRDLRLVKVDLARQMNIQVGDRVRVLFGQEKGKLGIVGRVIPEKNQVVVTGVNLARSFWHPEPGPGKPSIVSVECPIHVTNVVPIDPVTKQATRIKRRYMMDGTCVRVSKVSGCAMPAPVPVGVNEREELFALHEAKWLREEKSRRGPPKEDFFGNKSHFKTLVRIARESQAARGDGGGGRGGDPV